MAPSASPPAAIADGLASAAPAFDEVGRAAEPNGHDDGRLDGSIDHHALLQAMQAMRLGDFSVRLPGDQTGVVRYLAKPVNTEQLRSALRMWPHR